MDSFLNFVSLFGESRQNGRGYLVHCPIKEAHRNGDANPSLSIRLSEDSKVILVKCFRGCRTEDIIKSVGKSVRDLFLDEKAQKNKKPEPPRPIKITDGGTWVYFSEDGKAIYKKRRHNYHFADGSVKKTFSFSHYDPETMEWEKGMGNNKPILYNLQHRKKFHKNDDDFTFICEGEKCVEKLQNLIGTNGWVTTSGGSSTWRPEFTEFLRNDRAIILVPDNDEPGWEYAEKIAKSFRELSPEWKGEIVTLKLPGMKEKEDVADWIDAGGTEEEFNKILRAAIKAQAPPPLQKPTDFFELYEEFAGSSTDCPSAFHKIMGILLAGTLMENRVRYIHGHNLLLPNLWVLIVAQSSFDHKSTALMIVDKLLRENHAHLLMPAEFSHEGFVRNLQNHPRGLLLFDEFHKFYSLLSKDYNTILKGFLTELYDAKYREYVRMLSKETIRADEPLISIATTSTTHWLEGIIKSKDIFSGFFARFVVVPGEKKTKIFPLPPPPSEKLKQHLLQEMDSITKISGWMSISKEANDLYDTWYREYEARYYGIGEFDACFVRLRDVCLKICMILQAVRTKDKLVMEEETMLEAMAYTDKIAKSMENFLLNEIPFSPSEERIIKINKILASNRGKVSWSRALKYSHLSSVDFEATVRLMEARQELKIVREEKTVFLLKI